MTTSMSPPGSAAPVGTVASLWRYPVKSMLGEELGTAWLGSRGVAGDRTYALVDRTDGKVATAKNPRKWPRLFGFQAALVEGTENPDVVPAVRITLPDGSIVRSDEAGASQALSNALRREVTLTKLNGPPTPGEENSAAGPATDTSEQYWPDLEGLKHREAVTEFTLPAGTFFDCATVHLLTTATLRKLGEAHRQGRFEVPRFRPNLVIEGATEGDFPENAWLGSTLAIGDHVRLGITGLCGRCVMTTLAQPNLPEDLEILRTVHKQNTGHVGVYATVLQAGAIRRGDFVRLVT